MTYLFRVGCAVIVAVCATGCVGTTGGELVDFEAGAAGPKDAVAGEPLAFTTDRGFDVELTRASLHIGAMYLDQAFPVSGAQSTACVLPGTYVAEVTQGATVDLLDSTPIQIPGGGHGTTLTARAGQVWLAHDDVNAAVDPSSEPVLSLAGTTMVDGEQRAFSADVTISSNRQTASSLAGANPICKQRIVSPIPTNVTVQPEGALLLRIDPRLLFVNVDFAALTANGDTYVFSDDPSSPDYGQPSVNLYANLRAGSSLYTFSWVPHP